MHPENNKFFQCFLVEAFPQREWADLTPEKVSEHILQLRIWAIQEQEAFEIGVAETMKSFTSPDASRIVADLIEKYSPLQIAWMTREAARRCTID